MTADDPVVALERQRQRVIDELKIYDQLLRDVGAEGFDEELQGNDFLSHCLVIASWHRMELDGPASTAIATYRLTDIPVWQVLGLCAAAATYARRELITGDDDE